MWHLGRWFSDGVGSAELMVRLNLEVFSNLHDSMDSISAAFPYLLL